MNRYQRFFKNDIPKYIRCYDKPDVGDRFTVVFTGHYKGRNGCDYLGMSERPFHPQGIGQHGWSESIIDKPQYSHLGKKITFNDLPEDCKKLVLSTYKDIWEINNATVGT